MGPEEKAAMEQLRKEEGNAMQQEEKIVS